MSIVRYKALGLGLVLLANAYSITNANATEGLSSVRGVVTDSATNLQWQDSYEDNDGKVESGSFVEAKQYCSELKLANKQDWRLPSIEEIASIIDKSRVPQDQPAIQKAFKIVLVEESYLSSTDYENDDETVLVVDCYHGESDGVALSTSEGYHIRCVRDNKA